MYTTEDGLTKIEVTFEEGELNRNSVYETEKSKLCAQTRASSLTGGMPLW